MSEITLKIDGMSCGHCVMSVKKAIEGVEGVSASEVAVGTAKVVYDESKTDTDTITDAVRNAGYRIAG
ncbi:MAG TPA: copper chaperone [Nitrospirae bacterium]|nr:copper chaperone CopZ [bacterium BMS3Abin06]HDH11850.1 copper chaperone [Nitrospirota bacterium]HDZ02808.1 copper chaperone [Nitrospirota bacterium]